ncbi:MAG: HEPN domain-containing protein [Bacteroidetes bacterium]|nr:HEPN domain-containing protein [Bacteroidota bacterium]
MQSFRTKLENQTVEKDILDLEKKIHLFREGEIDSEKFRFSRLLRGIYGQRQPGVQMVRIKIPFGKLSAKQLLRIADISDEYSNGNLHLTTRQDVQIYYVSLDRTPELWAKLEQDNITLREACGNTVRNITASSIAGIDPKEPFDITPYANALFKFFLRNPIQENLGRKFKIAFSSSEDDTAFTFVHDLGFIPKVKIVDGKIVRGFKVVIGGGLGAQPILAQIANEFLTDGQIIPFSEATVRVFDRYGERNNRHKARLKYLIAKIGLENFMSLVEEERLALKSAGQISNLSNTEIPAYDYNKDERGKVFTTLKVSDDKKYKKWFDTNTFEQKQQGFFAVGVRVPLGNIRSDKVRQFAEVVKKYAADDLRITLNQGFLLRFVPKEALPALYKELDSLQLTLVGFDSIGDITACPGTDTCNLGIANSTGIALELEKVIQNEYSDLLYDKNIKIKISGCMNSCGQHSLAHIGFHGSSLKAGTHIIPALQVLLGGGVIGNGEGRISDKVIKIPSKRGPAVLREILNDYEKNSSENETFNQYFDRQGNNYFFRLLRSHADLSTIADDEYKDWGYEENYKLSVGVGECMGVQIDLVATLLFEAEEKIEWAKISLEENLFADSVYHSYSAFVQGAKALLLTNQIQTNSQHSILVEFENHFAPSVGFSYEKSFKETVLQINSNEPTKQFAEKYYTEAKDFLNKAKELREELIRQESFTKAKKNNQ